MAIIGLIAMSLILMLFNGGLTGVILLWGYAFYKWYQQEKRKQQWENYKRDFREKNGRDPW